MHANDEAHLNILSELKQGSFHDVPQLKRLRLHIKTVASHLLHSLPVPLQHCLVGHHLQEGTGLIEIIYLLLQVIECVPLLESLWKLPTPLEKIYKFILEKIENLYNSLVLKVE